MNRIESIKWNALKRWYILCRDLRGFVLQCTVDFFYFPSLFSRRILKYRLNLRQDLGKRKIALRLNNCDYSCRISDIGTLIESHRNGIYHKILRFIPKPGNVIVDVGANIGEYAILAARQIGKNGKVIAFEPNREAVRILRKNIKLNRLENIRIVNKAIYANEGSVKIHTPVDGTNICDSIQPISRQGYIAKATTLDNALKHEKRIDLVKMDIEGGEFLALKGANRLLKITPRIIMEVHSKRLYYESVDLLKEYGYNVVLKYPFAPSKGVWMIYVEA